MLVELAVSEEGVGVILPYSISSLQPLLPHGYEPMWVPWPKESTSLELEGTSEEECGGDLQSLFL